MAEAVIHLFEPVEVRNEYREWHFGAMAAGDFTVKMQEQGARIRQPGQVVGRGGILGHAILQSIFNGESQFRTDSEQDAEMVLGERVLFRAVKRQDRHYSGNAFERYSQGGSQRAVFCGIVKIAGLDRRIAIENRLAVLRDPAGQSLSERNL